MSTAAPNVPRPLEPALHPCESDLAIRCHKTSCQRLSFFVIGFNFRRDYQIDIGMFGKVLSLQIDFGQVANINLTTPSSVIQLIKKTQVGVIQHAET